MTSSFTQCMKMRRENVILGDKKVWLSIHCKMLLNSQGVCKPVILQVWYNIGLESWYMILVLVAFYSCIREALLKDWLP